MYDVEFQYAAAIGLLATGLICLVAAHSGRSRKGMKSYRARVVVLAGVGLACLAGAGAILYPMMADSRRFADTDVSVEELAARAYKGEPVDRVFDALQSPDTHSSAILELARRVDENELTEPDRSRAAGVLFEAALSDMGASSTREAASKACLALLCDGKLSDRQASMLLNRLDGPVRCRFDSQSGTFLLSGSTILARPRRGAGLVCRRVVELFEVDGRSTGRQLVDGITEGRWELSSSGEARLSPSESLRIRLEFRWLDYGESLPAGRLAQVPAPQRRSLLNAAEQKAKPRLLHVVQHTQTLRRSDYFQTVSDSWYWPAVVVGTSEAAVEPMRESAAVAVNAPVAASTPSTVAPAGAAGPGSSLARADGSPPAQGPSNSTRPAGGGAGALVLRVLAGTQAAWAGIEPGDVITAIQGEPVADCKALTALHSRYEARQREVTLRRGDQSESVHMAPGKMGVYLADYEPSSGPRLAEAARAFHRGDLGHARGHFEAAAQAGASLTDGNCLPAMWAVCMYYTGDPAAARAQVARWVKSQASPGFSSVLVSSAAKSGLAMDALYVVAAQAELEAHPSVETTLNLAHYLIYTLNRHPEALLLIARSAGQPMTAQEVAAALDRQRYALGRLDLAEESLEVVNRIYARPDIISEWGHAAYTAEYYGQVDLAATMARAMLDEHKDCEHTVFWTGEVLRLGLKAHQSGEGLAGVLEDLQDARRLELVREWIPRGYCWKEAASLWMKFAHKLAASPENDPAAARFAFEVLSRQSAPDVKELNGLLQLHHRLSGAGSDERAEAWERRAHVNLAMIEGDFETAGRVAGLDGPAASMPESRPGAIPAGAALSLPQQEALRFLRVHGGSLTGELQEWRRTAWVFAIPDGRLILLARDMRLGLTDANRSRVDRLPLPEDSWWVPDPDEAILVSPSGRTVLAASGWRIYRLDLELKQWRLISRKPWWLHEEWHLKTFEPALDDLVARLAPADGRRVEFVWPEAWRPGDAPFSCCLLSDGTWLVWDVKARRFLLPVDAVREALGTAVELYQLVPASPAWDRLYLITSRGLVEWHPRTGTVRAIALPGIAGQTPVMKAVDSVRVPKDHVRLALLPEKGGKTFLLRLSDGVVQEEGLVNEALPAAYWMQRPVEWKRAVCQETFAKAHMSWPYGRSSSRPAEDLR